MITNITNISGNFKGKRLFKDLKGKMNGDDQERFGMDRI
jgi:hypothetical protein